ncbi:DNA polymerase III subunit alpha [Patescibacteria group bacterium]
MSNFVHLHVHSHFSLLEALPKIKPLIKAVQDHSMDAVAVTDNGSMYGIIKFYQAAQAAEIKPIIGFDAYVAQHGRHQKRARIDAKPHRLVLLAENNEGYLNLLKLSSIGFLEGFYYKPRIDKELLREHSKGIIALSGGHMGEIDEALKKSARDEAVNAIKEYIDIFGKDNFYLELVDRPEIAEQEATNSQLIELGKELNVPVVATKNVFYLKPTEVESWKVLNCIKGGKTLESFERMQQFDYDASLVSGEYMEERFKDVPEAIENTRKIADRCNVELTLGEWNFPKFEIPEGKTFRQVLTERAFAELPPKIEEMNQEMEDRLNYELEIIEQKGFCPYFLIVSDFIEWARRNGIVTTTRGSAAGSLVSFAIGISTINPMHYKLPFERFLNPERPSAPDVDADFADNRRDEVLDYVRERYGTEKVAQICTFGAMLARGSVRDVGRALGFPYDFVDVVAKMIPMGSQGFPMTLDRALEETPDLKKQYDTDANVRRIIDLARQIEGCGRHVSIHAAGTVISPTELTDYTPLQIDTREGKIITQYEMKSVESAGLIKMDFLGIRNLSILGDAVALVKKTKEQVIVLEQIPVDDPKTFELLAKGNTMGVFQLGGDGMTKYLMELKPARVEDIMAMVALYRPGPIESIPEYIKRKFDPSAISFLDPRMEDILDKSYGVIVYQDDVMLIAIKLAGYSWLEADKLRKAMGKKIPEEMAKQKIKLHEGLIEKGMSEKKAKELWKLIEPFAAYGFNKAHAASYGMVAYHTAFMKANYPAEYMTALMTAESNDLEKIAEAVHECERMGIEVLPPDINESQKMFTYISDSTIRFGLLVIKNLGAEVIESIIEEREKEGEFKDLADFARRVHHRAFNKKSLEALIKAGALDRFGERKELVENIDRILMFNKGAQKEKEQNQASLFSLAPDMMDQEISLRQVEPAPMSEILSWEKELLGLYVSAHPYEPVEIKLSAHLTPCIKVADCQDGVFIKCGGVVTYAKEIITKKGDPMAFVGLEDGHSKAEVIVFPKTFTQWKDWLVEDRILLVSGKVSKREGEEAKIIANSFIEASVDELDDLAQMLKDEMWITDSQRPTKKETQDESESEPGTKGGIKQSSVTVTLPSKPNPDLVDQMRGLFQAYPGQCRVYLMVESGGRMRQIETDYVIQINQQMLDQLSTLVGKNNITVEGT